MKRLSLLDTINLRTTGVYRSPRDISTLQIVYGDLSQSRIPCRQIDKYATLFHISDRPMQSISGVYADDIDVRYGFAAHTAYQDETGRSIACLMFDNPQSKNISVSGKGAMKLNTGALIENPADLISDLFLNVQGYDPDSIDPAAIARFYADCLKEEIKVACILDDAGRTIKDFLDELALNIHARWMISDGKSVMRLRWI